MDSGLETSVSLQTGVLVAVSLPAIFVLWKLVRLSTPIQAFLRRFPWGIAVIELVLFPAAVYGSGRLVEALFGQIGLSTWQAGVREVTELLIILAVSSGVARLIELWLVFQMPTQKADRRNARLSQLGRSVLFGVCLFIGTLIYLSVNDNTPTELYVSTGAIAALIAFAMQQTLGDLFSGIALSLEKPFKIGDWLRFSDGMEGEVTDVNWRATRLAAGGGRCDGSVRQRDCKRHISEAFGRLLFSGRHARLTSVVDRLNSGSGTCAQLSA